MMDNDIPYWAKKVLTMDEAVQYTGFKKGYMYTLTKTGVIPHSKPNGKFIFFDREKLDQWLLQNPVKTKSEIESEAATHVTIKRKY